MLVNTVAKLLRIPLVIQISFDPTTKMLRKFESMIFILAKCRMLLICVCYVTMRHSTTDSSNSTNYY